MKTFAKYFLILTFICNLSTYLSDGCIKLLSSAHNTTIGNDKDLKTHLGKMQFVSDRKFNQGMTDFSNYTNADTLLFYQSIPSRINVASFYMSNTEVTNKEWKAFYADMVKEQGAEKAKELYHPNTSVWTSEFKYSYNKPHADNYYSLPEYGDYPVVGITWHQATAYCKWKSNKVNTLLKEKGIDHTIEFRLPTESEWESAAIYNVDDEEITERTYYAWSEDQMMEKLNQLCNIGMIKDNNGITLKKYEDDGHLYTSKVASFPPNTNGMYDMEGNVAEWTSDQGYTMVFSKNNSETITSLTDIDKAIENQKNLSGDTDTADYLVSNLERLQHDKKILSEEGIRVCKGGSWADGLVYTQPGAKRGLGENITSSKVGFRIVTSSIAEELNKYLAKPIGK